MRIAYMSLIHKSRKQSQASNPERLMLCYFSTLISTLLIQLPVGPLSAQRDGNMQRAQAVWRPVGDSLCTPPFSSSP